MLEMATGAWSTQTMYVAAKLKIADELANGPACAADVAERVGADPDALYRLMRALATKGLLDAPSRRHLQAHQGGPGITLR